MQAINFVNFVSVLVLSATRNGLYVNFEVVRTKRALDDKFSFLFAVLSPNRSHHHNFRPISNGFASMKKGTLCDVYCEVP